jgi:hypothetical protein
MASSIASYRAFDASALQFGPLDKNRKGGKIVGINDGSNSRRRIMIQTPVVALPFGVSEFLNTDQTKSYTIDLSFRGHDADPGMADFLARMRQLDEELLSVAVARSPEWFGKKMGKDVVKEFMRKLVKDPSNPQYAPTMKVKVPIVNGEPACQFFDENRQPVGIDYITKGTTAMMILELSPSVWFVNKNFGVSWRLAQLAVMSKPGRLDGFAFVADTGLDAVADEQRAVAPLPPADPVGEEL